MTTYEAAEANRTADEPTLAQRQYRRYNALLDRLIICRREAWQSHQNHSWKAYRRYVRLCRAITLVDVVVNGWFDRWQAEQDAQEAAAIEGASRLLEVAA